MDYYQNLMEQRRTSQEFVRSDSMRLREKARNTLVQNGTAYPKIGPNPINISLMAFQQKQRMGEKLI